jgi:alkanesulfonate monooxygenase SsuD/methylene tetrahydromethanopterin reductase-like flavin-dependent oxidoreductase (luciferase family)
MPILVGGTRWLVLRIAAEKADMWNGWGTLEELGALNDRLDRLCAERDRDPESLERLFMRNVLVRASEGEARDAWSRVDSSHGEQHTNTEPLQIGGPPEVVGGELRRYAKARCQHVTMPFREPFDYETIESLPQIRAAVEG